MSRVRAWARTAVRREAIAKRYFVSISMAGLALALALALSAVPGARADNRQDQTASVDCFQLRQQMLVVVEKQFVIDDGLDMLATAQEELDSNDETADVFAAAYGVLGGASIVLGVAALPAGISADWLDELMGGAAGLAALIQGGDAGEVTLAALVSYAGFGVVTDAISFVEFWNQYPQGKEDVRNLESSITEARERLRLADERLDEEARSLEEWMRKGGCVMARESQE